MRTEVFLIGEKEGITMNKVTFIGAGSMAEAVISGIVETGFIDKEKVYVTNRDNQSRLNEISKRYGTHCLNDKAEAIENADMIIIATKPVDVKAALNNIKDKVEPTQLIVSVVAGISTAFIQAALNQNNPVIRTMPNTSATIGYSATAIAKGEFATDADIAVTKDMFEAIGTVSVVKEDQMHVVTGLSGSGPAYIYYMVEALQRAAQAEGLDSETAKELVTQTIVGAGQMLQQREESAQVLRHNVTSPNGTTAAGIATLEDYHFLDAVEACVKNATARSRELGKSDD